MTSRREDAFVLFLDHQKEIVGRGQTVPAKQLARTAGVLARLCALHRLPVALSAVPPGGEYLPEITGALPEAQPRPRTHTTAWADEGLVQAIRASGRRHLALAGVASEIVVMRTALDARAAGFEVQVLVDACSGVSPRTEKAAFQRLAHAGAVLSSVVTFAAELAGDFSAEPGASTLGLMYEAMG
jgi:hypothetical protein